MVPYNTTKVAYRSKIFVKNALLKKLKQFPIQFSKIILKRNKSTTQLKIMGYFMKNR